MQYFTALIRAGDGGHAGSRARMLSPAARREARDPTPQTGRCRSFVSLLSMLLQ